MCIVWILGNVYTHVTTPGCQGIECFHHLEISLLPLSNPASHPQPQASNDLIRVTVDYIGLFESFTETVLYYLLFCVYILLFSVMFSKLYLGCSVYQLFVLAGPHCQALNRALVLYTLGKTCSSRVLPVPLRWRVGHWTQRSDLQMRFHGSEKTRVKGTLVLQAHSWNGANDRLYVFIVRTRGMEVHRLCNGAGHTGSAQ